MSSMRFSVKIAGDMGKSVYIYPLKNMKNLYL